MWIQSAVCSRFTIKGFIREKANDLQGSETLLALTFADGLVRHAFLRKN